MFSSKLEKRVQRMAVFKDSHGLANNWTLMNFISYNIYSIIGLLKWILVYYSSTLRRPLFQNPYELETLCDRRKLLLYSVNISKSWESRLLRAETLAAETLSFWLFLRFLVIFAKVYALGNINLSKLQSFFIEIHRYFSYFFVFLDLSYGNINLFL